MFEKYLKNQKGLGLIELMIASLIMVIVIGGSVKVFTYQQSLIKDENDTTKVRAKGRLALRLIAKEVRMAGFGMAPGQGIIDAASPLNATVNTLQFRTNLDTVRTVVDSTSADILPGESNITIIPGTEFANLDNVALYNPNTGAFDYLQVNGTVFDSATTMSFVGTIANTYSFTADANITLVNKYNIYTISQAGDVINKTIDGTVIPIINDLKLGGNGLVFDYNGATQANKVKTIGITLNMQDPQNPNANIELKTDVTLRNTVN